MRDCGHTPRTKRGRPVFTSVMVWFCLVINIVFCHLALAQDNRPLLGTAMEGVTATSDIPLDMTLPSGFVLSGTLQNADGSPVVAGSLTAQSETQAFSISIFPTTFPPTYRIVLPSGIYKLVAATFVADVDSDMGTGILLSNDVTEPIPIAGDTVRNVVVPVPPPLFPISGSVTSLGSLPTTGSILFESLDGKAVSVVPFDGTYALKLPAGDYNVAAIIAAVALEEPVSSLVLPVGTLTVGGPQTFDIALPMTLTLSGTVLNNDGTPAVLSSVYAVDAAVPPVETTGAASSCASDIASATDSLVTTGVAFIPATSPAGAYRLPLPPGAYSVAAELELNLLRDALEPRFGSIVFPVPSLSLGLTVDQEQNFLAPPLPGTVLISGTITDAQGQPVAGASVRAQTSMMTNTPNAVFTTDAVTDSAGQYALLTLSGVGYTIVACPPLFDLEGIPFLPGAVPAGSAFKGIESR